MTPQSPIELPLRGSVLDGRFRLEAPLGQGGMGQVHIAEDLVGGERVAVQLLAPHLADEAVHIERFLREARALAGLRHPNIVEIRHFGRDPSGIPYYVMELLVGEDLGARMAVTAHRAVHWELVRAWAVQITEALVCVHQARLIHRDLKPSNLFLVREPGGEERIKLIDFGIAKHEDSRTLTGTGHAVGTPLYMSPEQLSLREVDARADIYALGVVLYELLCGEPPFRGDAIQVGMQHCTSPPPPLAGRVAPESVPDSLQTIVLRALAKQPRDRFATAAAMHEALLQVTADDQLAYAATGLDVPGHHDLPELPTEQRTFEPVVQPMHPLRRGLLIAVSIAAFVGLVALSVVLRQNSSVDGSAAEVVDPLVGVREGALRCRARHPKAPQILIRYDISADGTVTTASTDDPGPLASCLLVLVETAHFPPGPPRPAQTIEL